MDFLNSISNEEREFFLSIKDIEPDASLWGLAISNVVLNPEVATFRRLIVQLKSQANDCPEVMQSIIGEPAYLNLKSISDEIISSSASV
jgi:hypothetical protein